MKDDFVYPPVVPSCPDFWQDESEKVKMFEVPIPTNRGVLGVYMNKLYGMTENK
jgi:hypothetical protein